MQRSKLDAPIGRRDRSPRESRVRGRSKAVSIAFAMGCAGFVGWFAATGRSLEPLMSATATQSPTMRSSQLSVQSSEADRLGNRYVVASRTAGGAQTIFAQDSKPAPSQSLLFDGTFFEARFTGDFDGDGTQDFIARGASGAWWLLLMDGSAPKASLNLWDGEFGQFDVIAAADFNADGRVDLLWRNEQGHIYIAFMTGVDTPEYVELTPPSPSYQIDHVVGMGDDGIIEIAWRDEYGHSVYTSPKGIPLMHP
jgi:FG-GAP-like repeat